jgi:hypothetical protein
MQLHHTRRGVIKPIDLALRLAPRYIMAQSRLQHCITFSSANFGFLKKNSSLLASEKLPFNILIV